MTNEEAIKEQKEKDSVEVIMQGIAKAIENVVEDLRRVFEELPRYLKYEYAHPRKKPRGSMRRARRERAESEVQDADSD